jgi:hypothetical protein
VGRHKPKKVLQVGHGVEGGSGLGAGQRTGGGKDTVIDTVTVVEQVANGYLELFLLDGGHALRCGGAVYGRMVESRAGDAANLTPWGPRRWSKASMWPG